MKTKILLISILLVFIFAISAVSAKEATHINLESDSFGSCVIVTLKDSNNNPIPSEFFDINITKNGKLIKKFKSQKTNKTGKNEFYLGNGEFKVDVIFKGNDKYSPSKTSKSFTIHKTDGKSMYYYYDENNYGDSLDMDEYISDSYWDEDIYDDPSTYDGEGY